MMELDRLAKIRESAQRERAKITARLVLRRCEDRVEAGQGPPRLKLAGVRFGTRTVVGFAYSKRRTFWRVRCDCGREDVLAGYAIRAAAAALLKSGERRGVTCRECASRAVEKTLARDKQNRLFTGKR